MSEVILIVATSLNDAIGKEGKMPWHQRSDLKYFKRKTAGCPLIMGRKTWESIGSRPLPGRETIVMTRRPEYPVPEGVMVSTDILSALDLAEILGDGKVFVCGGEQIYRAAFPYATKVLRTIVKTEVEGADAFFPSELLDDEWLRTVWKSEPAGKHDDHAMEFEAWVRSR